MSSAKNLMFRKYIFNNLGYQVLCRYQSSHKYKSSLLLPQTKFPHKISATNRRDRDRKIEIDAKFHELYEWQQIQNDRSEFILHDGPPYANGDVHIGHAVNKILKDITVRYQLLNGNRIHFLPGWDCHGLPIELKVLKENHASANDASKIDISKRAYAFSQVTKEKQMSSFKEWGILADWKNSYFTCKPDYVIQQLNVFQDLYEKGIIFRDHKPVFWSPHNRTSLAEAELEYNSNHVSPSVFIKFSVIQCPEAIKSKLGHSSKLNIVIWTTTPWSLPANQAVCYAPEKKYCIAFCQGRGEFYLVAQEMVSSLEKAVKTELHVVETFEGSLLKDITYCHPISKDRECPLLPSHHVTMDKGTGLVHMAPNHGLDDYLVAKKQHLPIDPCLVDENGYYNNNAIQELKGKEVLGTGSKFILDLLVKDILHLENFTHSYPYDWRSKTPVIIRSCHQWFIDVHQIREKAIESLENVNIIPEHLKKVFISQLESSPQWCISRQRAWGVPIPAFYSEDMNKPLVNRALTEHLCSLIKTYGIHCWLEKDVNELFPSEIIKKLNLDDTQYQKGSDIMDIWFDSGISWRCVLPEPHISDVCIEGVDQIRGWFNSSLLTSVAIRGKAPHKTLVLHGFTTDSKGHKMSKSEGNVISPVDILSGSKKNGIPAYGIDVLRWWVASHACQPENIAVKMNVLEECSQNLNKIRNVLKFLLGSLHEYDSETHMTAPTEMRALDLCMLYKLQHFTKKVSEQYNLVQYKHAAKEILNFVTNDVSAFYCHLIKDRLYCDAQLSKERLDCQTVLYFILNTLIQRISPICPHLANEVFLSHPDYEFGRKNVFSCQWPDLDKFMENIVFPSSVTWANEIREVILKAEVKTIHMEAFITCSPKVSQELQDLNETLMDNSGLTEFLQVSDICFAESPETLPEGSISLQGNFERSDSEKGETFSVMLIRSKLEKCPRCRLYSSNSQSTLCNRCANVINITSSKQSSICK